VSPPRLNSKTETDSVSETLRIFGILGDGNVQKFNDPEHIGFVIKENNDKFQCPTAKLEMGAEKFHTLHLLPPIRLTLAALLFLLLNTEE
jgi:hypothetical protein